MPDSVRPHRRQPTRLRRPWDSPGKNTGVGCHFLLQCMKREKWKWSHLVVFDTSRPHGLQPTRLLRPWDLPGKSTGVGCHCLLQFYIENLSIHRFCSRGTSVFQPTVHKGFTFSTSLPIFVFFWIFDSSHLMNIRWHIIVVLICISLMISDIELIMSLAHYVITQNVIKTFSYTFWPFVFCLWRNVYSSPLSIFLAVLLDFFCCWVSGVLYIFWILMFFQTYVLQTFFAYC